MRPEYLQRKGLSLAEYGEVLFPSDAQEPILARPVREALSEWLTEIRAREELESVGLKPRQKALFTGPPGTGKTTLAHHLAARLQLPMLLARSDRLIDSFVGATDQNIGRLFDLAAVSEPHLIFIDEFDTIGLSRRKASQGADDARNSMVNTLLQRMERYDGYLIAATNMADHLDQAVWRRFDIQIAIELPGVRERELILARYLEPFILKGDALKLLAESFGGASPALIRQFSENLKRQLMVGPKVGWNMEKGPTVDRLIAAVQPHPDLSRPALWHRGSTDPAIDAMPWPLAIDANAQKAITAKAARKRRVQ